MHELELQVDFGVWLRVLQQRARRTGHLVSDQRLAGPRDHACVAQLLGRHGHKRIVEVAGPHAPRNQRAVLVLDVGRNAALQLRP